MPFNGGSPYGWILLFTLGLSFFLASLVRKRRHYWALGGVSLLFLSLGGGYIFSSFFTNPPPLGEFLIFTIPLFILFFVGSLRLAIAIPLLVLLTSGVFILWGSSGIYTVNKGVFPVQVTCYPSNYRGRSYHVLYADGRESTVSGAGNYLVINKVTWMGYVFFVPQYEYPLGFSKANETMLIPLTLKQKSLPDRPGLRENPYLIGPFEDKLFYTWWIVPNSKGVLSMTSLDPHVSP